MLATATEDGNHLMKIVGESVFVVAGKLKCIAAGIADLTVYRPEQCRHDRPRFRAMDRGLSRKNADCRYQNR